MIILNLYYARCLESMEPVIGLCTGLVTQTRRFAKTTPEPCLKKTVEKISVRIFLAPNGIIPAKMSASRAAEIRASIGRVRRYRRLREPRTQHRNETIFCVCQFVECALQFFKLLSSLAELAFSGQAPGSRQGLGDERVEICCGLGRCGGCRCASHRLTTGPPEWANVWVLLSS